MVHHYPMRSPAMDLSVLGWLFRGEIAASVRCVSGWGAMVHHYPMRSPAMYR